MSQLIGKGSDKSFLHLAHEEFFVGLFKSSEVFCLILLQSGENFLHGCTTALGCHLMVEIDGAFFIMHGKGQGVLGRRILI